MSIEADFITVTALLNCLTREIATVEHGPTHLTAYLPCTGQVLRAAHGRWPRCPELRTGTVWRPLAWPELAAMVAAELAARTGHTNDALLADITASHRAAAALVHARTVAPLPADPFRRSEQALVAGHRFHPAPKARGHLPAASWLPYAPEAYAQFTLPLVGIPAELVAQEGDVAALDALPAPLGYHALPVHPWQLALVGDLPQGVIQLGYLDGDVWPTSSVRTVYDEERDLFLKFSLDVRITNDIRRLWSRDLRWVVDLGQVLRESFNAMATKHPSAAVFIDRGYRTVNLGDEDIYEALAVVVRDGVRAHLRPGIVPLLAAGLSEGFPGSPLDGHDSEQALDWWRAYVDIVVPPVLMAYFAYGIVLECHLQNVVIGVDETGLPVQILFRDSEGTRLVVDRHAALLHRKGMMGGYPGVDPAYGWNRLVYCLVTNHLQEIAGALVDRHPGLSSALWEVARELFAICGGDHGYPVEIQELLDRPDIPAKANLLLRWTEADGAATSYVAHPNPLLTGLNADPRGKSYRDS
ncbi:MAG: IucA/IucC family protein [Pseudonocardiaceae bacterium]